MKVKKAGGQLNMREDALLALVRRSLIGEENSLSEHEQIEALKESRKQAMYCIAADKADLSEEASKNVNRAMYVNVMHNTKIHAKHNELSEILEAERIPYVIIKGSAAAMYYPKPILRMMGDIDFYVPEEYKNQACEVLESKGFEPFQVNHSFHVAYEKDGYHFELHYKAPTNAKGEIAERIYRYFDDITQKAFRLNTGLDNIIVPSVFHHGLVLLLHTAVHLFYDGVGLRNLCDWAMLVNTLSNEEFREIFEEKLEKIGLLEFAKTLSLSSVIAFNIEYKEFMGDNRKLAKEILDDILASGTNGRKNMDRRGENLFINNKYASGNNSRTAMFIRGINEGIYGKFPVFRKIKILVPFVWLFLGIRRVIRESLNMRYPLKVFKSFRNSKSRDELYARLNIFKTE